MPHPTRSRHLAALLSVIVVSTVTILGSASPGAAHTALVLSNPAAGAQLSAMPSQVRLTFNEAISPEYATLTLTTPEMPAVSLSTPSVEGAQVDATVPAATVSGADAATRWTLNCRVVSGDGHPVAGTVEFTVTDRSASNPGSASPSPSPAEPTSSADEQRTSNDTQSADADQDEATPGTTAGRIVFLAALLVPLIAMPVVLLRRRKDGQE